MVTFDGVQRFKRAIKEADRLYGVAGTGVAIAKGLVKDNPTTFRRFTVHRKMGEVEKPVAFGMTQEQAELFLLVAPRCMAGIARTVEDGQIMFATASFRMAEDL